MDMRAEKQPLSIEERYQSIGLVALLVTALVMFALGMGQLSHAADAPPRAPTMITGSGGSMANGAPGDGLSPPGEKPRETVYRPLRTSPTFRHPPGHGKGRRASDVPIPGAKPLPPEFGYASRTSFDDITSLDELEAIARRLYSVAYDSPDQARESLRLIVLRDQAEMIPPLVHAMQFSQLTEAEISAALRRLSGINAGVTWFEWAQWLESQPQLVLTPGLSHAVVAMWSALDGKFRHILPAEQSTQVPKASIYWDGSRVDAIASRQTPKAVGPNEAFSLKPDDLVLGVSAGGAFRAYPLPQLLFSPIINDELGGKALTIAFEPLCGFPVAYDRGAAGNPDLPDMHWSGLVYRSARLLYTDASTADELKTPRLWDPCTNRSVSGASAVSQERLPLANATLTSWSAWRSAYPQTTVIDTALAPRASDESLEAQDRYIGAPTLVYPVHLNNATLPAKERMLLIDMGERDDAIRLHDLKRRSVVNHRFGDQAVVIVVENPLTCTIRVYRRPEGQIFAPSEFVDRVFGSGGGVWKVTEDALVGPDGEALERLPTRGLFWFSVDGLNPLTEASLGQSASLVE